MEHSESVDRLIQEAKAALDQANKAQTRADDLKLTSGRKLLEAKTLVKTHGGKWLEFLSKYGLDKRRVQEVMRIARGDTVLDRSDPDEGEPSKLKQKTIVKGQQESADSALSKTNEVKLVATQPIIIKDAVSVYNWDSDEKTKGLKTDLQQANRKIDYLKEELDDLKYSTEKQKLMLGILKEADEIIYNDLEKEAIKRLNKK